MKFTLTIPKAKIKATYEHVLEETAQKSELKGFRKGKAPKNLVEKKVGKTKLLESVVEHVLSEAYVEEVKKRQLHPLTAPKITPSSVKPEEDWVFEVEVAEAPQVMLGNYQEAVKGAKAKNSIWIPGKDNAKDKKEPSEDEKLKAVFDALLETTKLEIPTLLVEEEVNRALSRLVNQVNRLGLTIDQYVSSMNTTTEKLREEYQKTAIENLRLEFILQAVAEDAKINVSQDEINRLVETVKDTNTREKLKTPEEQEGIRAMLRKRKTVDYLLSL